MGRALSSLRSMHTHHSLITCHAEDTVRDIQSLFKSQLSEFDYEVQDAWVSSGVHPRTRS